MNASETSSEEFKSYSKPNGENSMPDEAQFLTLVDFDSSNDFGSQYSGHILTGVDDHSVIYVPEMPGEPVMLLETPDPNDITLGDDIEFKREQTHHLADPPQFFSSAIEKLRTELIRQCTRPQHDYRCRHRFSVYYNLSPLDKCLKRLFPNDVSPLSHWKNIKIIMRPTGEWQIQTVDFGNDLRWNLDKEVDGTYKIYRVDFGNDLAWWFDGDDLTFKELIDQYNAACMTQYECMFRVTCNHFDNAVDSEEESNERNTRKIVMKSVAACLPYWLLTQITEYQRKPFHIYYFFSGPIRYFNKARLIAKFTEIVVANKEFGTDVKIDIFLPWASRYLSVTDAQTSVDMRALSKYENRQPYRSRYQWILTHELFLDISLALAPLNLPAYVLMWILDYLPESWPYSELQRINLLSAISKSCCKVYLRRESRIAKKSL